VGRVAQSVQRLATGWTVRGSNPGGDEIFRTCPDRPWEPPSLLHSGYQVFPGGKERPGCDADPPPPSSAVGYERVELYLYSPYWPYGLYRASVPVQRCTLPYSRAIRLLPPMGRTTCTEPQCLYKGALYLFLYGGHVPRPCKTGDVTLRTFKQHEPITLILCTF
jgi:hypothetical protein